MKARLTVLTVAVLALGGIASADFVDDSCTVEFADDPLLEQHSYTFDYTTDTLYLHEGTVDAVGPDPSLTCWGDIDSDPVLAIVEDATNDSGVTWTGWKLELDPNDNDTFLVDSTHTPSSDYFGSYTLSTDAKTLTFHAPTAVPDGDTVELTFYINVPYEGGGGTEPFSFTLTQTAIPEPMTLSLLSLGGLALLRRKR
jgi:hypothetical protein